MARTKPHRPSNSRSTLGRLLVLLLAIACVFTVAASAASPPGSPKIPQGDTHHDEGSQDIVSNDLICPTDVAAECYPRVFQPTNEFQRVRPDQAIPAGLHVRLNINTGDREAKLNDDTDEVPAGLEGLSVDRSVVLVDQPNDEDDGVTGAETLPIPRGAPAYDPVGAVKEPIAGDGSDGDSALNFLDAVSIFKDDVAKLEIDIDDGNTTTVNNEGQIVPGEVGKSLFERAADMLDEFSHDIYYGLKLVEDSVATQRLLCMTVDKTDSLYVAQKAAAIIASAVQNNQRALQQIEKHWEEYKAGVCAADLEGGGSDTTTLGKVIFATPYYSALRPQLGTDAVAWTRSRLLAVNGLIKSKAIMNDFLASGGLAEVLRLLVEQEGDPAYDTARRRAANLVIDNFLDEGMGADVSLWPGSKAETGQKTACGSDGQVHGHCWNHHINQLAKTHRRDKAHWAHDLQRWLQKREDGEKVRVSDHEGL